VTSVMEDCFLRNSLGSCEYKIDSKMAFQVWMRLPRVEVRWRLEPSREDKNQEWVLRIELFRRVLKRMPNARAYVPYFPKVWSF
jgi:hypothetical protein